MNGYRQRLEILTRQLLQEPLDFQHCRASAHALKALFEEAVGFEESEPAITHIETENGRAVSTVSAAICIVDFMRTRVFLQGVAEAIAVCRSRHPERPVRILYAGCGPFATLLTPLTTLLEPGVFTAQLLDLNGTSLGILRKTIQAFGMQAYVHSIIHADATQYKVPDDFIPDIIISETMLQALAREPIVNIFAHLAPQCPAAIMIPGQVTVTAALSTSPNGSEFRYQPLATLMELSAETARLFNLPGRCPAIFTEGVEVNIPADYDKQYKRLLLFTFITVFGTHRLQINESSLTLPFQLGRTVSIADFPAGMVFRYSRGPVPGFVFEERR